jgi:hypothetical protein
LNVGFDAADGILERSWSPGFEFFYICRKIQNPAKSQVLEAGRVPAAEVGEGQSRDRLYGQSGD